jgi:hypothetical protein
MFDPTRHALDLAQHLRAVREVMRRRFAANVVPMPHRFRLDRTHQPQRFAQLHMRVSPSATATSTISMGTLITLAEGLSLSSISAVPPMRIKAD